MLTIQPNLPKLRKLTHFDVEFPVMGSFSKIRLTIHTRSSLKVPVLFSILNWPVDIGFEITLHSPAFLAPTGWYLQQQQQQQQQQNYWALRRILFVLVMSLIYLFY